MIKFQMKRFFALVPVLSMIINMGAVAFAGEDKPDWADHTESAIYSEAENHAGDDTAEIEDAPAETEEEHKAAEDTENQENPEPEQDAEPLIIPADGLIADMELLSDALGPFDNIGSKEDFAAALLLVGDEPVIFTITDDIRFDDKVTIDAGKTITLRSADSENPQTIYQNGTHSTVYRHFYVLGTLILEDIILDGETTSGGVEVGAGNNSTSYAELILRNGAVIQNCLSKSQYQGGGITVKQGGWLEMYEGSLITGCENTYTSMAGGGVYVDMAARKDQECPGIFHMYGGQISKNKAKGMGGGVYVMGADSFTISDYPNGQFHFYDGEITHNEVYQGHGGSHEAGGGVAVAGAFHMNGGLIANNHIKGTYAYYGGGVEVLPYGSFWMTGGIIEHNTGAVMGGGVNVYSGKFTMTGGEIRYNEASTGGGGIGIVGSSDLGFHDGVVTVEGGVIAHNTTGGNGGAVNVNWGTLIMKNSRVENNKAKLNAGGILLFNDSDRSHVEIENSVIVNNAAGEDGGGICVRIIDSKNGESPYNNLKTGADVIFGGNTAVAAYNPPADAEILYPDIEFATTSITEHPLNNYDINYVLAPALELAPLSVKVIDQEDEFGLKGVDAAIHYDYQQRTYYYAGGGWTVNKEAATEASSDADGWVNLPSLPVGSVCTVEQADDYWGYKNFAAAVIDIIDTSGATETIPMEPIKPNVTVRAIDKITRRVLDGVQLSLTYENGGDTYYYTGSGWEQNAAVLETDEAYPVVVGGLRAGAQITANQTASYPKYHDFPAESYFLTDEIPQFWDLELTPKETKLSILVIDAKTKEPLETVPLLFSKEEGGVTSYYTQDGWLTDAKQAVLLTDNTGTYVIDGIYTAGQYRLNQAYDYSGYHSFATMTPELTDAAEQTIVVEMTPYSGSGSKSGPCTVTFHMNDGTGNIYLRSTVTLGAVVSEPENPGREGFLFGGWYKDEACTIKYDFAAPVRTDLNLYAKWEQELRIPFIPEHYAYIIGYQDGSVRPEGNMTRAEVATVFFRLLQADFRNVMMTSDNTYLDVAPGDWYNTAVSTMSRAEVFRGYEDGTFRPDAPITRGEFAAVAASFTGASFAMKTWFTDVENHWANQAINVAASLGWVEGYPDGTYRPENFITRAEVTSLVNRVLQRQPDGIESLLAEMTVWPDNKNGAAWYYIDIQEATNSHECDYDEETGRERWTKLLPDPDWRGLEQPSATQ